MRLRLLICLVFAPAHGYSQGCAQTAEAAAIATIGGTGAAPGGAGSSGYRVQDVQVDAAMQRVWMRISKCGDASAPLILVPVRANLAGGALSPQPAPLTPSAPAENAAVNAVVPIAVHAGDAVKAIFVSTNVQMELDATANGQAPIGGVIDITLARRGDEPPHRMRGVVRASGRVEVQP